MLTVNRADVGLTSPSLRELAAGTGVQDVKSTTAVSPKQEEESPNVWMTEKDREREKTKIGNELKKINEQLKSTGNEIRFRYDDDNNQTYVEVIDSTTREVVRSMPPEFMRDLSARLKSLVGLFVDEKR